MENKPIVPDNVQSVVAPVVPKNEQVVTIPQNAAPSNPYDALDDVKKVVAELRARSIPYKTIVYEIKAQFKLVYSEGYLRQLCMTGTPMWQAIVFIQKQRADEYVTSLDQADVELKMAALDAIAILRLGMEGQIVSKEQRIMAQDILDRTGFPKTSKTESTGKIEIEESVKFTAAIVAIAESIKK